ncbi:TIGR04255 family protein [Gelidibacter japonicus]|uniref:TIGR04255 family protein n=1 Tax=Gelidibacter japonicus TaxID=1962232 RepID=UPI003A90658D
MKYPVLLNTPIKEIIFSISYDEIVDKNCFDDFVNIEFIKKYFTDIKPSVTNEFEISNKGVKLSKDNSGFHLKRKNEVLQMRKGSMSYHYLNEYSDFNDILDTFIKFWKAFDNVTKDNLTISEVSVRYINVLEVDKDNPVSDLVQLYPKQSKDRNIKNFQSSVTFSYSNCPEYLINAVSTLPKEDLVLLDITISKKIDKKTDLTESFKPLREIKNRVFFDSITAKALLKYINQK